jgi:hypothetical protein
MSSDELHQMQTSTRRLLLVGHILAHGERLGDHGARHGMQAMYTILRKLELHRFLQLASRGIHKVHNGTWHRMWGL